MKKITYILLFCFLIDLFTPLIKVVADVTYTFSSGNYHVVYINDNISSTSCDNSSIVNYDNTNIEYLSSFDTYDEALTYLKTLSSTSTKILSIIGDKKNKSGTYSSSILYTDYGLVDLNTTGSTQITSYIYTSATNNTVYTYINGSGYFGGTDSAFINYNNGTTRSQIKNSGATGWINSLLYLNGATYTGYDVVPLTAVKSPSYYYVNDSGELVHVYAKKITANNCYSGSRTLGPAPTSLTKKDSEGNTIKYYSYDGNYFYTSLESMLSDYKNAITTNSVNSVPYFNYYMYLPIRTKTNLTSDDIKNFLESRSYTTEESSALYGEELTFIDAQNKYGVNAAMSFATAINESVWGTSLLAKSKNNIFGHNAVDSNVMSAANGYNTVADGIYRHAYYMINAGFAETKDAVARYYGSNLGNKSSGMNVKYASDVYWGEKIASYYYSLDNYNDMKDYYKYTIGIKTSDIDVEVKKEPNNSSSTLYKLESYYVSVKNMPVVILERVTGEEIDGNNIWYKIQTDALLTSDRNDLIRDTTIDDLYDWDNNYAYVHSSYITLMDESVEKVYTTKEGMFGLEELTLNETNNTVNVKGYLAITGTDNSSSKTITYDMVLVNQSTNEKYELPLNRITNVDDMPYTIPEIDGYDYTHSWFNGNIDLSSVNEGNYTIYIRARSGNYESKEILSNKLSKKILSKFTDSSGKGYQFRTNYYLKSVPVELFIRNNGLISSDATPTMDNMINQYQNIELTNGKLQITGTSFNVGGDYSTSKDITRKIIFENTTTFERFEYDLGYIDNGEYEITLLAPDNLSKTRAWYSKSIDLSELTKGTYAIYVKTLANVVDAGELTDIFNRNIDTATSVNNNNISLRVNTNQRYRLELIVK